MGCFRSAYTYTNITHILAGRLVARAEGAKDWGSVLQSELLDPLGMKSTSYTRVAIEAASNPAQGHRFSPDGSVEIPFTDGMPYRWEAAGAMNSTVEDMANWLRLQLGNGTFAGQTIISADSMAFTRTPKIAESQTASYAMGWVNAYTPNGTVLWHNGGTDGFAAYVGLQLDRGVGVVVLTNENFSFCDAVGAWFFDRVLGNSEPAKEMQAALNTMKKNLAERLAAAAARPRDPRPFPSLASLAGHFSNPMFGDARITVAGDTLILAFKGSSAELELQPWDGEIFRVRLIPKAPFAAVAEALGNPHGFAQFRMRPDRKLGSMEFNVEEDGQTSQTYEFKRD